MPNKSEATLVYHEIYIQSLYDNHKQIVHFHMFLIRMVHYPKFLEGILFNNFIIFSELTS